MAKKIPRRDYEVVTKQQIRFVEKSCLDFDNADEIEAIRIAGHLRTILHDSHVKKNFDSKLTVWTTELKEIIDKEAVLNDKKIKNKILNKVKAIHRKIEQQQKKQILSKSLLTQIGLKNIKFLDTSTTPGTLSFYTINKLENTIVSQFSYFGLLAKDVFVSETNHETVKYQPLCSHQGFERYRDSCNWLDFDNWWHKIIYNDGKGVSFSRKELVQVVANQDGYAHFEENIDLEYLSFKQANILEDFINANSKSILNMPTLCSIRQIAYETMFSIKKHIK
jgi:hypothetical protein